MFLSTPTLAVRRLEDEKMNHQWSYLKTWLALPKEMLCIIGSDGADTDAMMGIKSKQWLLMFAVLITVLK